MRKKLWILVSGFLLLALVLGLSGCGGKNNASQGGEVKIGVLAPLTGNLAQQGEDTYRGAEIAKDLVNDKGGVWGKKVVFAKADTPDANAAVSEATRLINTEQVKLIFGPYGSGLSYPASAVADRNKITYFDGGAVANNITERGFKYLFRFYYSANYQGVLAAKMVVDTLSPKLGIQPDQLRVAVIHEDGDYGTSVGNSVKNNLEKSGVKNVTIESYNAKAVDLTSLVLKVKSFQPDVVIATSYAPDSILFWRQSKENGLNVKAMIGTGGGYSLKGFAEAMGDDANGVMSYGTTINMNPAGLTPEAQPLYKEFFDRYQAKYQTKPSEYSGMGFTAMYVLLHNVLPKAGSFDPDKIREVAMGLDMPPGSTVIGYGIKFDEAGNNIGAVPMLSQWQNKQLYAVYPEKFATANKWTLPLPPWGQRQNVGK